MKTRRIGFWKAWMPTVVLWLAISGMGIWGCGGGGKTEAVEKVVVPVEVMDVGPGSIERVFSYTGNLESWKEVNLVSDIGGKVDRIFAEIGDRVGQGQILARLDQQALLLQLRQAEAAVAVARSSLADAEKNDERGQDLFQKESISQQQYEKIQLAYDAAKSQNQQAESALALVRWQLDVSVIKAPFSGVITGRWINEGEMINPQMPGSKGILSLMDLSRVKIRVHASEQEIPFIRKGNSVRVVVDVFPDRVFAGSIHAVNAAANPMARTFEVQVVLPNPDGILKAGMFARASIVVETKSDVLVIPVDAVLGTEQDRHVYTVAADSARKTPLSLGVVNGDHVEVVAGLETGQKIVVVGQQMLKTGTKVSWEGGK